MYFSTQYISNKNSFLKTPRLPYCLGLICKREPCEKYAIGEVYAALLTKRTFQKLVGYGLLYDFQNVCLTGTHTCMMCVSLVLIPV